MHAWGAGNDGITAAGHQAAAVQECSSTPHRTETAPEQKAASISLRADWVSPARVHRM